MENRRKVLFIDKKFQFNLIVKSYMFFCFLFIALIVGTYVLIAPLITELAYLNLPSNHAISLIIKNFKFYAIIITLLSFLAFSCFVIMVTLLMSHKIAGPIYGLRRILRDIVLKKELKYVSFREKDYFINLQKEFNQMIDFLKDK